MENLCHFVATDTVINEFLFVVVKLSHMFKMLFRGKSVHNYNKRLVEYVALLIVTIKTRAKLFQMLENSCFYRYLMPDGTFFEIEMQTFNCILTA